MGDYFSQRPKTPFFVGEDLRYTRRLLFNLLCAKKNTLVEEAIEEGAEFAGVINKDVLWHLFTRLPDDPEYANVDLVLDLVNESFGVDGEKAMDSASLATRLPVEEVTVDTGSHGSSILVFR